MEKEEQIDEFLAKLREQSANDLKWDVEGGLGEILQHFAVACKKCGSTNIFVSWEKGIDYGGYTGYSGGQKLFKCLDCGNAASFWE